MPLPLFDNGWLGVLDSSEVLLFCGSEEEVDSSEDDVDADDEELLLDDTLELEDGSELVLDDELDELRDEEDLDEELLTTWLIVSSEDVSAPTTEYSFTPLTVVLFTVLGMVQSEPSAPLPDII